MSDRSDFRTIVGDFAADGARSSSIVRKVADSEAAVLITGESGTGKELVARAIHAHSRRSDEPFVAVNCAAIPDDLLESELFGHVKGAFTGAVRTRPAGSSWPTGARCSWTRSASCRWNCSPNCSGPCRRKVVEPVGGTRAHKLDVRLVAATNLDMEKALSDGTFREDLYYRLSVIPIHLPPLRERPDDIPLLLRYFCAKHGSPQVGFDRQALDTLVKYCWPGNVRELENTVERLLIMRNGDTITSEELSDKIRSGSATAPATGSVFNLPAEGYSLEQLEREVVVAALERNNWNQTAAARFLRIPRHTLIYRMEKYGIISPEK